MITPAVDRILNPASTDSRVPLVKLPFGGHIIYLNSFVPRGIHYVGTVFAHRLWSFCSSVKALAEYFGTVEIQYVGLAAITDLRNRDLRKAGAPAHRLFPEANHRAADVRGHQRRGARAQHAFGNAGLVFPVRVHACFSWCWSCC